MKPTLLHGARQERGLGWGLTGCDQLMGAEERFAQGSLLSRLEALETKWGQTGIGTGRGGGQGTWGQPPLGQA